MGENECKDEKEYAYNIAVEVLRKPMLPLSSLNNGKEYHMGVRIFKEKTIYCKPTPRKPDSIRGGAIVDVFLIIGAFPTTEGWCLMGGIFL